MRPLIAVIGRRSPSAPILRLSATLAAEAICEAIYSAGGEPAILHGPSADPRQGLPRRLERFDGVVMPGGADLGPDRYGQAATPETLDVVAFQDDFDLGVALAVVDCGVPTLAICRGMQVLNVALGGTLHQHHAGTTVGHLDGVHEVKLTEGSRLQAIAGSDLITVSSYHHQTVDRLAPDLVVSGVAGDGVLEAVEHRFADVLGVQWHPEDLYASSSVDADLFADLVERAGGSFHAEARESRGQRHVLCKGIADRAAC